MALATTCPKCSTSFRVAPEQLASRRGMVRCGICQNVFSGMANLRHVDEVLRPSRSSAAQPSATPGSVANFDSSSASARARGSRSGAGSSSGSSSGSDSSSGSGTIAGSAAQASRAVSVGSAAAKRATGNTTTARSIGGKEFEQTDLRTAFFLPETVFGPSTEMVAQGQEFIAAPTVLPSSLQNQTPLDVSRNALERDASSDRIAESTLVGGEPIGLKQPTATTRYRWALENSDSADRVDRVDLIDSEDRAGASLLPADNSLSNKSISATHSAALASGALVSNTLPAAVAGHQATTENQTRTPKKRSLSQRAPARNRSDEAIAYFATEESSGGFTSRAVAFGWLGCMVAALVLIVQLVIVGRSAIAGQFPSLRAPLAALVSPLGLKLEPARDLQALTIEAFELQAANSPGLFSVSALLRNRSARGVLWPALEMTLTDGQGTLLVRKVLLPADYLPGMPAEMSKDIERGVSPRAELPLRLALEARDLVPTNYSVTLFYP